jgi:hypothetical protein
MRWNKSFNTQNKTRRTIMKKQTKRFKTGALVVALVSTFNLLPSTMFAQGTAFTYQGRLNDGANPANGTYDLRFAIYDSTNNLGVLIAGPITSPATGVTNGLFTVTLDFGTGVFTGPNRWLDLGVRTNGAVNFIGLTPRQPLTPTPYAIFANTSSNVSGIIANSSLPASPSFSGTVSGGSFSGNGANLTSLDAGNITAGTLPDAQLSANVALLNRNGQTFTGAQDFNGGIGLNSSTGFEQSSIGAFDIDAPFIVGGRVAVLANGNVGIGNNNPTQKLQVAGTLSVSGAATFGSVVNLPSTATINAGANHVLFSDGSQQDFFAGQGAGSKLTSGSNNSGVGYQALGANTTGIFNTGIGDLALDVNVGGSFNTATGAFALGSSTNGSFDTAVGYGAMASSLNAVNNTSVGFQSLFLNTNGNNNTATGYEALFANTANNNTAFGAAALSDNTTGSGNVAVGDNALTANALGNNNTAVGHQALSSTTGVGANTAIGYDALQLDTTGGENVAIGAGALTTLTTGSGNIAIGNGAGLQLGGTSSENIDIGDSGSFTDQNTIRIGGVIHHDTYIAGIYGSTAASGVQVFIDSNGHLGTLTSSARFKQNIRSMGDESDVLLSLRPVSFQYKPDYDPQGTPQFGLIAEEVDKVDPDLVARDGNNHIYTVRYQAVSAMLLNEFLKQHQTITSQNQAIQALKQQNESLEKRLNGLEQMMKSTAQNN